MSTGIKTITGRFETMSHHHRGVVYDESKMNVTRFWGGKENGRMIQLTIYNSEESAYIQLTQKQVKKLSKVLKNAFNDNKYPSE